jgi:hypothetical protein
MTMRGFYVLGALLALAACAPQPAPPPPAPPPPPAAAMPPPAPPPMNVAAFNGTYAGPMILQPTGQSTQNEQRTKCTEQRTGTMTVRNGTVTIQYADWRGHILHYRGTVDATGTVNLVHTNGDGSKAILTGQIQNNGFVGDMRRDPCEYSVQLARR